MSEIIRSFRDLIVWRKAMDLAKLVYGLTKRFPGDERFCLVSQVRRSAVSVSANIAEGHARQGNEFAHFLSIARGSLAETESHIQLAFELGYVEQKGLDAVIELATEIRRMSASLARRLVTREASPCFLSPLP